MKKEIRLGVIIGYISMAVSTFVAIFFTPILLNNLGTSEYGIYALISSVIAYFSVLDLGLGSTAVRYISKNYKKPEDIKTINGILLKIYIGIGIIALLLGIILYFISGFIFTELTSIELHKFKISLLIMTVSVAISFPFSVYSSYITANEKFVFQKTTVLLQNLLKPFLMIIVLIFGYKSIALVAVLAFVNLFTYLLNYYYARKKLNFEYEFKKISENKPLVKEMFNYSFFILLATIVDTVFKNTDQVILGAVSGTFAVSIYNLSMQIRSANSNFSAIISQLFFPKLTKMVENKEPISKISEIFNSVSRIQMMILTLIASGFIMFGISFIDVWVGEEFREVYFVVLICMLPNLIPLSQNIGIYVLQAMNKHQFRAVIFFIIAILNIVISIPLAMKYNSIGAAIGTAIAVILGQIIAMNIYYSKVIKLNIKRYWINFTKIVIPVLSIAILLKILVDKLPMSLLYLIMYISIYSILYSIYMYVIIMNTYEKGLIKEVFIKICRKSKLIKGEK